MRNVNERSEYMFRRTDITELQNKLCGSESDWKRQSTVSCAGGGGLKTFALSPRSVPGI